MDLSRVQSIKEWEDGCDELEGISHSFQLELDAGMTWGMFTDSQEQKVSLLNESYVIKAHEKHPGTYDLKHYANLQVVNV